jgi:hypothetical protein
LSDNALNAVVEAIRAGTAPEHVRAAAARGALPIPRGTLTQLYVKLLTDSNEGTRADALSSLNAVESDQIIEALKDEECPLEVFTHFAKQAARDAALAEAIAFHPSSPVPALTVLAALGNRAVIDLVMTNEELLLKQPILLDRLMLNPALGHDQRGRLLELLGRADRLAQERAQNPDESELEGEASESSDEELAELAELLEIDVGELLSVSEILGAEELEAHEDLEIRNVYQKIITLNAAQKAVMALKGGREERLILVRDTNKIVAMGVLKNPRITDDEVEGIAKMRNVTEDVLRMVGSSREYTKNYSVVLALVNNPKTPQQVSTNFITRLNNRDLKLLVGSREVPELIRRMARKTFDLRNQRAKGSNFKKK